MPTKIAQRITGYSVVQAEAPGTAVSAPPTAFIDDADRKLRIEEVPTPLAQSIRWAKRPVIRQGNDGHTYMVEGPHHEFGVHVGHYTNGAPHPFEVWALGDKAPRGLSALAKSLSMDMRSNDRGFLRAKLKSLKKTRGTPFDMVMPNGFLTRHESEVAVFASLIEWRCQELGAFDGDAPTPVLDALMSPKEPKTTSQGAMAWYADIKNPATKDDFKLFAPEVHLPNGQCRPFSIWMAGHYPESLDGLCKCLSFDLRVVEVEWGVRKLRQLLNLSEPRGEFFAEVPGSDKRAVYPSTVAYVAAVLLHRLQVLGLVNGDGSTAGSTGNVALRLVKGENDAIQAVDHAAAPKGLPCEECGAYAVIKSGGCEQCTACEWSRCG